MWCLRMPTGLSTALPQGRCMRGQPIRHYEAHIALDDSFLEGLIYRDDDAESPKHFPISGQVGEAFLGQPERVCDVFWVKISQVVDHGLVARSGGTLFQGLRRRLPSGSGPECI